MKPSLIAALTVFFLGFNAHSQSTAQFRPDGITGGAGLGYITFTVQEPEAVNFNLDDGTFAALYGEKGFGFANLYLTVSLSYLQTEGRTNYEYSSLSQSYTADDVNMDVNIFQAGLGIKFKLLDDYFIRPYIEAGGLGGFFKVKYKDIQTKLTSGTGSDYKKDDSLFDTGVYVELGGEFTFSPQYGLKVGARFTDNKTKKFDTLGEREVEYKAEIYYLTLLMAF